jgi:hypothetical protein
MSIDRFSRWFRLASWALPLVLLAGCGGGGGGKPSGVYLAKHPDSPMVFIQKYDFKSGDTVAVTAMGNTETGTYAIADDGQITITMPVGHKAHLKKGNGGCLVGISDPGMVAEAAKDGVDLDEMGSYCPD